MSANCINASTESLANMKQFVFLLLVNICMNRGVAQIIVNTTNGAVEGTTLLSRNGREISAFLGIPYAKSTDGELRFKAPQPAERWNGIRDASSYGPVCSQYPTHYLGNSTGDENCLAINVFTHTSNLVKNASVENDLLPVLVYIHGGFFMVLSGSYHGPRYLLDHEVILVTFNYRLGVFGFLGVPEGDEHGAPGNAGMKDQVLALKWVQENIHNFGGDANRVTIYGESAGAAAVHYLLLSNQSKGLFAAAISGSGTAFKLYSHQVSPKAAAEKLAIEVGCGDFVSNTTEMITCLRMVNASLIVAVSDEWTKPLKDPLRMFAPSTESKEHQDEAFISEDPYKIFTDGLQQTVPWMIGVNSGEGFFTTLDIYASDEWTNEINKNWMNGLASKFLLYNESDTELTRSINEFYLNASVANGAIDFRRDLFGFTNLFSDRLYIHASMEAAKIQSQLSPVFLYYNDYITDANSVGFGTMHGEELALLFSPANFTDPIIDETHPDYEQSKAMVDLWVQFVTDPHNMHYNGKLWSPVESFQENVSCLVFKNSNRGEQGVSTLPEEITNRVNFWNAKEVPPYQERHVNIHA